MINVSVILLNNLLEYFISVIFPV